MTPICCSQRHAHRPACKYAPAYLAGSIELVRALEAGDRVWFHGERQGYTVQAKGLPFLIVTKPFNARRTVIYSVIDIERGIRGTDNCYGIGYETPEQIAESLEWLTSGRAEVSHRNHVQLRVVKTVAVREAVAA